MDLRNGLLELIRSDPRRYSKLIEDLDIEDQNLKRRIFTTLRRDPETSVDSLLQYIESSAEIKDWFDTLIVDIFPELIPEEVPEDEVEESDLSSIESFGSEGILTPPSPLIIPPQRSTSPRRDLRTSFNGQNFPRSPEIRSPIPPREAEILVDYRDNYLLPIPLAQRISTLNDQQFTDLLGILSSSGTIPSEWLSQIPNPPFSPRIKDELSVGLMNLILMNPLALEQAAQFMFGSGINIYAIGEEVETLPRSGSPREEGDLNFVWRELSLRTSTDDRKFIADWVGMDPINQNIFIEDGGSFSRYFPKRVDLIRVLDALKVKHGEPIWLNNLASLLNINLGQISQETNIIEPITSERSIISPRSISVPSPERSPRRIHSPQRTIIIPSRRRTSVVPGGLISEGTGFQERRPISIRERREPPSESEPIRSPPRIQRRIIPPRRR